MLEGALAHKDSIGNASTIVPGGVQRMSADRRASQRIQRQPRRHHSLNGLRLGAGDGVRSGAGLIDLADGLNAEILLFDLPP